MASIESMKNEIINDMVYKASRQYNQQSPSTYSYIEQDINRFTDQVNKYTDDQVRAAYEPIRQKYEEVNEEIRNEFNRFISSINSKRAILTNPKTGLFGLSTPPPLTQTQKNFWVNYDLIKQQPEHTTIMLKTLKELGREAYPDKSLLFLGGRRRKQKRTRKAHRKARRRNTARRLR